MAQKRDTEIAFSLCVWTANVELYLYIYKYIQVKKHDTFNTKKYSYKTRILTLDIFFSSPAVLPLLLIGFDYSTWKRTWNFKDIRPYHQLWFVFLFLVDLSLKGRLSNAKFRQDMACHWSCSVPLDDGLNEARILKFIDISDIQNSPPWWFLNCRVSFCFFCPWKSGRGRAVGLRFGFTDYEFRQWSQAPLLQG